MRLLPAALLLGALCIALPRQASAQYSQTGPYDPFSWHVYNEGPGIKFGHDGMVFHPGAAAEVGYDSNVLMNNNATGAPVLRLKLHFDLATLPPQRLDAGAQPAIEFRLGGAFEFRQYLTSINDDYARQFNAISDAYLKILPNRPLSLQLYNNFIVTNDARNLEFSQGFQPRIYERFGALGVFRPGNGPLEVGLGDAVRLDWFIDRPQNRSVGNEATLYAQLRVLPQTTVRLELRSNYVSYFGTTASGVASGLPNAAPQKVMAVLNTLLIPALGFTGYVGYGNSVIHGNYKLYTTDDVGYNNAIGGAELRLRLAAKMRLALGYARDFNDSIIAAYEQDDRLYLNYDHYIWRGLVAHLNLGAYLRHYGSLVDLTTAQVAAYGSPKREDVILNLNADLAYRVLSWMEVGVSYSLVDDITDFTFTPLGSSGATKAAFVKHVGLARIDFAY